MTPREIWRPDHTAELFRLIGLGVTTAAAAETLNFKFGTQRTRKSCASHLYDRGHRTARGRRTDWPAEHDALLKSLRADNFSFSEVANEINSRFGTDYTRNACIGRSRRIGICEQRVYRTTGNPKEWAAAAVAKRREKRWAANPSLKARYERLQEMKKNRAMFASNGATKTSAGYRMHMPRLPADMSRNELRAMLTAAVQNTAAMVVS